MYRRNCVSMKAAFIGNFILLEFVAFIWAETSSRHHERLLWLSLLPQFPLLFRLILVNPVAELLEKPKNPAVETWLLFAKKQDYARDRLEWSCHGVGTIENRNLLTAWGSLVVPWHLYWFHPGVSCLFDGFQVRVYYAGWSGFLL